MFERSSVPGVKTSEFWKSVGAGILGVIAALVALFIGLSYIDEKTGQLIIGVATALVSLAVIIVPAWLAVTYTKARSEIKKTH